MAIDLESLLSHRPVLTDGAWGTQFQLLGLPVGACPDTWNLEHPELVEQVARAYAEAGSQVVLTNTFRANRIALRSHGISQPVATLNQAGVAISRRAAAGRALVFASMGPSGKLLVSGDVTADELRTAFAEQARALADAGADALVIETMTDLAEALLAVEAANRTGLPVVACMVFDADAARDRTMRGTTPEEAAQALTASGAAVVGANCGQGIESHVAICRRLRAATDRPIWLKANAGLPELVNSRVVYPTTAELFASFGPALVAAGASFIGGCCGTAPNYIRALGKELRR
jgi:methionine synthase I (cobalamin-dependent)